jgi:mRNA interferase YafQ
MFKYTITPSSAYEKNYKKAKKSGLDMKKLQWVIDTLADGLPLPEKYRDHKLNGKLSKYRECHVSPDWLLVYRYYHDELILALHALGSHSNLF